MEESKEQDNENFDKIKVFSSEDEKLKILGELLSNQSSRDIIKLLIKKEMYTNEIAKKLELRSNLVIHHLQKMKSIGLVEISNKKITRKGEGQRFFKIPSGILIFPEKVEKEANNGFLKKIFKEGIKFASIIFVTIGIMKIFTKPEIIQTIITEPDNIGNPDSLLTKNIPNQPEITNEVWGSLIIAVIIISVTIIIFIKKRKR